MALGSNQLLLCVIAILLSPVAVFLQRGCGGQLAINVHLTLLFIIPGIIHAIYLVLHDENAGRPPRHVIQDAHAARVGLKTAPGQQDGPTTQRPRTPVPATTQPTTTPPETTQPTVASYNHDGPMDLRSLPPMYNSHNQYDIARTGPGMAVSGTQLRSTTSTPTPQTQSRGYAMEEV